jgi:hypothetical protein
VEVRPPSQSDSCVATQGYFTVSVQSPLRGDRSEGRMQDGTVTTESSHDRVSLVGSLPTGRHPELGTGAHALQSFDLYV